MTQHPDSPHPSGAAINHPAESRTRVAVENWENEGGHFSAPRSLSIVPSNVSSLVPDQVSESPELAAMRARFVADFSGGTMGQHHNTYQHRARLLRLAGGRR